MINIKNKKAFTLAEVLITLAVLGTLVSISMPVVRNSIPVTDNFRIKKAHTTLKTIINDMLNDSVQYAGKRDFSNNEKVYETNVGVKASTKTFKKIFLSVIKTKGTQDCLAYGTSESVNNCYVTVDGISWCVPETDFDNTNMIEQKDEKSFATKFAPITVYPKYEAKKAKADPQKYMMEKAIFYGVRRDGKIVFLDIIKCDDKSKEVHCTAQKLIKKYSKHN